jgi:hypothetical protein
VGLNPNPPPTFICLPERTNDPMTKLHTRVEIVVRNHCLQVGQNITMCRITVFKFKMSVDLSTHRPWNKEHPLARPLHFRMPRELVVYCRLPSGNTKLASWKFPARVCRRSYDIASTTRVSIKIRVSMSCRLRRRN